MDAIAGQSEFFSLGLEWVEMGQQAQMQAQKLGEAQEQERALAETQIEALGVPA